MTFLEKAKDLQMMASTGQSMAALDKYYADNVTVIEGNGAAREGKEAQRAAVEQWMESVGEIHGGGLKSVTSNEEEGVTCTETWIDLTFKDGPRIKLEEVAVQKWEGDHIVHERFYFDAGKLGM